MAKKKEVDDIVSLTPVEHILKRPGMWIGATTPADKEVWVLDDSNNFVFKTVNYTEGLLKICNEAIDNSIDIGRKTNWRTSNKITVNITSDTFSIEDNGTGIPVVKDDNGDYICVNAVCKPMTGSNFEDEDRTSIGANGVGIKGANIFSSEFICITDDGNKKMKIVCKNNLSEEKHTESKSTGKTGTKITFKPDFSRFGVKEFRPELITMLKTRLKILSWYFPECTFNFNGEKINIKSKNFSSLFPEPSVTLDSPNAFICAYASEEPRVLTYVNGIYLSKGGNHINYILDYKIVNAIKEKVIKKYKNIKPADIKNRLGLVVLLKDFPNCSFNSQTKEELTNSYTEITKFVENAQIKIEDISEKILKQKEMIANITDLFRAKEELAEKKMLAQMSKTVKNVESEKYFPPISNSKKKYLMLTEGFSAFSGISPILGRRDIGYYMLKGKVENITDEKASAFMKNQEINDLSKILGFDLTNPELTDFTYERVVILTDADPDGVAIAALLLNLFNTVAPRMVKEGRVCRLETPLMIGLKGDKVIDYFFEFPKKKDLKKGLDYCYLKGLGTWTKSSLDQVIEKEGGMENLLRPFTLDETSNELLYKWFSKKTSDERKEALRGKEFHLDKA